MFKTLINAWKIKDLRTKMLYTLLLVVIYRFGSFIPVPGVNSEVMASLIGQYDALGFLSIFSGSALSQFSIFAMGISPYITGSIIIQLLCIAIPALERISKEEDGRTKIEKITRYVGIGLALVQSIGIVASLQSVGVPVNGTTMYLLDNPNFFTYASIGVICTAGTAFLVWLGERITEKGVGNGTSFIIFTSICSSVPTTVIQYVGGVFNPNPATGTNFAWWILPILLVIVLVLITGVTLVDKAERRIPVQYAKRVVGRKMYGGQSTHIPLKANANGVMPLIFAMTIIQVPTMILQIADADGLTLMQQFLQDPTTNIESVGWFTKFYMQYLASGTVVYYIVYALLIVAFAYFYTTISFNPVEISKNLQQNGGFIPGIRPGRPTGEHLAKISNRLTLFGAFFLMVIAIVPTAVLDAFGLTSAFGPTSLLIMVSVALETSAQLESMMLMRHYKGFLG
ncbi:MAG: preprotein translocase subunit SecY [Clostridiales bacterium]|nr:preprotein translocase subunit SecY [Clostridiales bacterium]